MPRVTEVRTTSGGQIQLTLHGALERRFGQLGCFGLGRMTRRCGSPSGTRSGWRGYMGPAEVALRALGPLGCPGDDAVRTREPRLDGRLWVKDEPGGDHPSGHLEADSQPDEIPLARVQGNSREDAKDDEDHPVFPTLEVAVAWAWFVQWRRRLNCEDHSVEDD